MKNDYLSLYMKPQPNNNASLNYAIFESSRCTLYNVAPIWDHVFPPTWTIKIHCLVIAGLPANNCRLFKYSFGIFEICLKTQTKGPFVLSDESETKLLWKHCPHWPISFALPRWNDSEMDAASNSFENHCITALWGWLEAEIFGYIDVKSLVVILTSLPIRSRDITE